MKENESYKDILDKLPKELKAEFEKIISGELLPQLHSDFPFKQIYNPDTHKDRLTLLFRLVFEEDAEVISSLGSETAKASLYSKKTIVDLLAKLSNGGIANFESQVSLQEFIVPRMNIYESDMIMLQYSVNKGNKKAGMTYTDIPKSYLVIFMKESPEIFANNESFIHVKEEVTDTGIKLPALSTVVYIELDKCLRYIRAKGYPKERKELCKWLVLMADSNAPEVRQLAVEDVEKQLVLQELERMSKNREELMTMLADKYEEITRYSELQSAEERGEKRGRVEGRVEGESKTISQIRKKLQKKLSLSEIADMLELEVDYVEKIVQLIEEFPQKDDMEIMSLFLTGQIK